jgi:hypothetical protein
MRVNTGTAGGSGGTTGWSSCNFGSTFNVNTFTIAVSQLPPHNHGISDPGHGHSDVGHSHAIGGGDFVVIGASGGNGLAGGGQSFSFPAGTATSFANITANGTGVSTTNTGSNVGITPNYTTPQVKYTDFLIGVKA